MSAFSTMMPSRPARESGHGSYSFGWSDQFDDFDGDNWEAHYATAEPDDEPIYCSPDEEFVDPYEAYERSVVHHRVLSSCARGATNSTKTATQEESYADFVNWQLIRAAEEDRRNQKW